nr:RNA-directed DNA polymerase, eukaryota [Tanacetum cinerariifolium]
MHLHANVVRFERSPLQSSRPSPPNRPSKAGPSYASAVKGILSPPLSASPAMVLDDSCSVNHNLKNYVMGEVKQLSAINNLRVLLSNEGFSYRRIIYLGGQWVMIELPSAKSKSKLMKHVGVASWFKSLSNAQPDFVPRDRIVWVDVEGVPMHVWSRNTFHKIGAKWGEVLDLEECRDDFFAQVAERGSYPDGESDKEIGENHSVPFQRFNAEDESDSEEISETVFGDNADELGNDGGSVQKEASHDPFEIYDLLHKKDKVAEIDGTNSSIPFPTGFTPEKGIPVQEAHNTQEDHGQTNNKSVGCSSRIADSSQKVDEQLSPRSHGIGHNNNKKGGSILDVLEEMIKVGQTMGFTMDGCTNDMEKIIGSQGVDNNSITLNDNNGMLRFKKKLQILKKEIRKWIADRKKTQMSNVHNIRSKLRDINKSLDQGEANDDLLASRMELLNQLHDFKTAETTVKGVMIDGEWVDEPNRVKEEFRDYFAARFNEPGTRHGHINYTFPNRLNEEQVADVETPITRDEIRLAVWGCGENKSSGLDGFTFEFFRKFWVVVGPHFCTAVEWFFDHASFPIGCNSSFIALIPKSLEPKTVGDYRPISLIGCLYKVVTKILATRLSSVISDLVSDVQTAFLPNRQILDGTFIINELLARCRYKKQRAMIFKVDFAKAYDSIRWDYLEAVLNSFGFGHKWRSWIQGSLYSSMASIFVNGSPTFEFQFHRGLKQGDPLAPYLFILIMESLHLSFSRVIEAGVFTGGRLTLLKSVLGSTPIYNMSLYKVPKTVLNSMESIRRNFFNGIREGEMKIAWVKWTKVLASKKNGGLRVSSFFALNRGLLVKWMWRFLSRDNSLWARFIHASHGSNKLNISASYPTLWSSIIKEFLEGPAIGDSRLCLAFPRLYALENNKDCTMAVKMNGTFVSSFRRDVRGGLESTQLSQLLDLLDSVVLSNSDDRWVWDLNGEGIFQAKDARILIDDFFLPKADTPTRWVKSIPIKLNIFDWKVSLNRLPTRINLFRRGVSVSPISCSICHAGLEDLDHLLFCCSMTIDVTRSIFLGLNKGCTDVEVKNAYKKLALRWHPDRCSAFGSSKHVEEANKKFQAINEAYSALSNENKRLLYDVGVYDCDDDENGMSDFLSEMAEMMSQNKPAIRAKVVQKYDNLVHRALYVDSSSILVSDISEEPRLLEFDELSPQLENKDE